MIKVGQRAIGDLYPSVPAYYRSNKPTYFTLLSSFHLTNTEGHTNPS
jgi:hypothetical protein